VTEDYIPTLTHATERDIDLLLVEELYASAEFASWLAARTGITRPVLRTTVKHSKRRTRSRREIDIFVELHHSGGETSALLIENKLDATEQPDQAESYREELSLHADGYAAMAMIITCPQAYGAEHGAFTTKFDAMVTYEEIADCFVQRAEAGAKIDPELASRYAFRAEVLDQAIFKHRRGYRAIPSEVVGDFNARYVALLADLFPTIKPGKSMLKPANPGDSTSMIFDQEETLAQLPADIRPRRFAHELGRGLDWRANYVAATFGGWGGALPAIKGRLAQDAAELGAQFASKVPNKTRPNPGLVMALPTAPVANQGDFDAQRDQIVAGMRKAAELRDWLIRNQRVLWQWKALVEQNRGTS
jgi:hypothetical protein